jgi:hypothetical protein
MSTQPGFSSRSTTTTISQLQQRDGATVADINGMEEAGWSNSEPVEHAPEDVYPEVTPIPEHVPGSSNGDEVKEAPVPEPVEHAIVPEPATPDVSADAADEPTPAKKTTARKSTARKKG